MLKYTAWLVGAVAALAGLLLDFRYGVLAVLLLAAVWTDLASRRIPNRLVYPGIAVGVGCQALLPDGMGVWAALQGAGLGLVLFLPLYLLHAMGAGDVKLMAMVGAFVGPQHVVGTALVVLVAGGALGLAVALGKRAFPQLVENLKMMFAGSMVKLVSGKLPVPDQPAVSVGKLPYALAIAGGTLAYLSWRHYTTI